MVTIPAQKQPLIQLWGKIEQYQQNHQLENCVDIMKFLPFHQHHPQHLARRPATASRWPLEVAISLPRTTMGPRPIFPPRWLARVSVYWLNILHMHTYGGFMCVLKIGDRPSHPILTIYTYLYVGDPYFQTLISTYINIQHQEFQGGKSWSTILYPVTNQLGKGTPHAVQLYARISDHEYPFLL